MVPKKAMSAERRGFSSRLLTALAISTLALSLSAPANAQSIDAAKAAGQAIEKADGLLAVCPGAPASVSRTVQAVNAKRLEQYRSIAAGTGATMGQVQARAGAKLQQSSPGRCK